MYKHVFKRILDVILSLLAIIVASPIFLAIAIAIKIDSPGPVFFCQKRVGKGKTFFKIYKFRTMQKSTPKDVPTHLLANSSTHITKVGNFLRKTSLDELPQVANILSGKMSIVGPRPALWNQDDLVFLRDEYEANALRPGLTGYAQINGRDELPIAVKAKMDGYYAKNLSFALDFKIMLKTVTNVFKSSGIVEGKQD